MNSRETEFSQKCEKGKSRFALATGQTLSSTILESATNPQGVPAMTNPDALTPNTQHTPKTVSSKMEHTRPQWRVANGDWILGPKTNGREQRIAHVLTQYGEIDYPNSSANARLIAAAPAMLEALRGIAGCYRRGLANPDEVEKWNAVRAAIAQATEG